MLENHFHALVTLLSRGFLQPLDQCYALLHNLDPSAPCRHIGVFEQYVPRNEVKMLLVTIMGVIVRRRAYVMHEIDYLKFCIITKAMTD